MSCFVLSQLLSPPLPPPWTAELQTWLEIASFFPAKEQGTGYHLLCVSSWPGAALNQHLPRSTFCFPV